MNPTKAQLIAQKAKNVNSITAQWLGTGLPSLVENEETDVQRCKFDDIQDLPIIVFGYSLRTGSEGEFAVIAFSTDGGETVCSTTTGSGVILNKLKTVAGKNQFPVQGKFIKPADKRYYDFVD